jgi:hypothetical protein
MGMHGQQAAQLLNCACFDCKVANGVALLELQATMQGQRLSNQQIVDFQDAWRAQHMLHVDTRQLPDQRWQLAVRCLGCEKVVHTAEVACPVGIPY